jgi:cytochrome c-type biogenesis protein CcmH/NrfF
MSTRSWIASIAFAGALLALDARASEFDSDTARQAHRISQELMSPYCPGRTLSDCPSPDAAALRQEVRERLEAGVPERELRQDLARRYGDALIGVPRGRLGWLLPALLLAAGAGALAFALRRLSRPRGAAELARDPLEPELAELARELDRDLRER